MDFFKKILKACLLTVVYLVLLPLLNALFEWIASLVNGDNLVVTLSTLKESSKQYFYIAAFLGVSTSFEFFKKPVQDLVKSNKLD